MIISSIEYDYSMFYERLRLYIRMTGRHDVSRQRHSSVSVNSDVTHIHAVLYGYTVPRVPRS